MVSAPDHLLPEALSGTDQVARAATHGLRCVGVRHAVYTVRCLGRSVRSAGPHASRLSCASHPAPPTPTTPPAHACIPCQGHPHLVHLRSVASLRSTRYASGLSRFCHSSSLYRTCTHTVVRGRVHAAGCGGAGRGGALFRKLQQAWARVRHQNLHILQHRGRHRNICAGSQHGARTAFLPLQTWRRRRHRHHTCALRTNCACTRTSPCRRSMSTAVPLDALAPAVATMGTATRVVARPAPSSTRRVTGLWEAGRYTTVLVERGVEDREGNHEGEGVEK